MWDIYDLAGGWEGTIKDIYGKANGYHVTGIDLRWAHDYGKMREYFIKAEAKATVVWQVGKSNPESVSF